MSTLEHMHRIWVRGGLTEQAKWEDLLAFEDMESAALGLPPSSNNSPNDGNASSATGSSRGGDGAVAVRDERELARSRVEHRRALELHLTQSGVALMAEVTTHPL